MSDISEMESRISLALGRISAGVSAMPPASAVTTEEFERTIRELESVKAELVSTKTVLEEANAKGISSAEQAQEVQQKHVLELTQLRAENERLLTQLSSEETVLGQLKQVNADLRSNNEKLRDAMKSGLGDASLVNAALETELEGVKISLRADRAELDAVLGELGQLIGQGDTRDSQSQSQSLQDQTAPDVTSQEQTDA